MSISAINYGSNPLFKYDKLDEEQDTTDSERTTGKNNGKHVSGAKGETGNDNRAPRVRRQPPRPGSMPTWDAYASSASQASNAGSWQALSAVTGINSLLMEHCAGLTTEAMLRVASGEAPDLDTALRQVSRDLAGASTRRPVYRRIRDLQTQNEFVHTTPLPGHTERQGRSGIANGSDLANELASQLGSRHPSSDGSGSEQYTFARLTLTYYNSYLVGRHVITIQRVHPSNDYRNNEYQLYDPNFGVFHYRNFQDLSSALARLYSDAYRHVRGGGVASTETTYSADSRTYQPYEPSRPRSGFLNSLLSAFMPARRQQPTPPSSELPPPPDFDQPGPSGAQGHPELKRALKDREDDAPHPFALYRPSTVSPEELKKQDGFSASETPLGSVSLDTHDYDVQNGKRNVDGAGYLGTFRGMDTARQKLDAGGQKDGYIYDVAPTPNMVDVNGSLGNQARNPNDQEVAAMGNIQYTQIRGWRRVHDGKVGSYEANPDYRWDIYDQTKTAGARPELAGFSPENPAWGDDLHKPFASQVTRDGKTFYKPNEDPAMKAARFMQHANAQIRKEVDAQSSRQNHRGPVHIKPAWNNNEGDGATRLHFYNVGGNGYPSVDSSSGSSEEDELRFGDDGRIHLARDYSKVLRIDSNGNAYIGDIPQDKSNLNGVFVYKENLGLGTLVHLEDGKLLTEGISAYTPYVAEPGARGGVAMDRQRWKIENRHADKVQPPMPRQAYNLDYKTSTAGDPDAIRDFLSNPDSALPRQATHFVTTVPGATSNPDNLFLSYVDHIKAGEARAVNDWLRNHNAAWLFGDGFCAVSIDANTLEVRAIGGTPVWHVRIDPATGKEDVELVQHQPLSSNFRVPDDIWKYAKANEASDNELESRV